MVLHIEVSHDGPGSSGDCAIQQTDSISFSLEQFQAGPAVFAASSQRKGHVAYPAAWDLPITSSILLSFSLLLL